MREQGKVLYLSLSHTLWTYFRMAIRTMKLASGLPCPTTIFRFVECRHCMRALSCLAGWLVGVLLVARSLAVQAPYSHTHTRTEWIYAFPCHSKKMKKKKNNKTNIETHTRNTCTVLLCTPSHNSQEPFGTSRNGWRRHSAVKIIAHTNFIHTFTTSQQRTAIL